MVFMSSVDRITFLVGAGLAQDAGLPVSVTLAENLRDSLERKVADEDAPSVERETAKIFLATLRLLNGGIRFQEGMLNRNPDAPVNIEQLAVAAIQLAARYENPLAPYTSGWHQKLSDLEGQSPRLLQAFIDYIYSKLTDWLTIKSPESVSYLARFVDFGKGLPGIDIFSLNYDLCIETSLKSFAKETVNNGFTEDGWKPDSLESDSPIRLFKLHGSLDWVEDEMFGLCALDFPRHKSAEEIDANHRPLLIFGTSHKLSARQPFLTLAYYFSQVVLTRQILVVIGYGFGDDYVNEIIEQGVRSNTRLRIVVVCPSASDSVNRRPILANNPRVILINEKAANALNGGVLFSRVQELLKESAEESPF